MWWCVILLCILGAFACVGASHCMDLLRERKATKLIITVMPDGTSTGLDISINSEVGSATRVNAIACVSILRKTIVEFFSKNDSEALQKLIDNHLQESADEK